MYVESIVHSHGGIMHRTTLRNLGVTPYRVRKEIDAGLLQRVGRHRVAVNGCDTALLRAARLGGRLSCVSAARFRGLWALDDERLHVSVPRTFSVPVTDRAAPLPLLHWGRGPAPVHLTDTIEPLANMLLHIAQCQPHELAVAIIDSGINKRMLDLAELKRLARSVGGRLQAVIEDCDGGADSGIETVIRVRLGQRGIALRIQIVIDGHPVDGLIGDRLVIQADGYGPHSTSSQRSRDLMQDARLALRGYTVLRFTYAQILYDWSYVEAQILAAMSQGLHLWERH
jgi:very-short-patch-repair endonuclease